jgi:Glyoxalase-like domain
VVEFGVVVLGVSDRDRASAFWRSALSYQARTDGYGGWAVVLEPADGRDGTRIALQLSESAPPAHPRMHLDLHVASRDEQLREADRLIALGASKVAWDYPDDPDFVVLADTEANPFCVVDLSHSH